MIQICKVSIGSDIMETVQGLQVNIPDSLDYARIKDTSVPAHYNGQKNPAEVGNRLSEPFDVIEYDRAYTKLRKYIRDDSSKKQEE